MQSDDVTRAATTFAVLDHSPIGHFVLRRDLVILFWNKCLEAWTGIPRGQIVGGTIAHHFPNLSEPKYASRIQSMFDGGPPTIFSSQLHRHIIPAPLPSGKFRSQYTVVTGVPAPEMKGVYALFSIQDVTSLTEAIESHNVALKQAMAEMEERKRAEAELVKTAQELKRLNEILKERAIRDGHTGLYNHRYFYQILRRDFLLALRHQSDLSCLLLDLDNFKNVNDLYGHPFGDVVLKGVAGILQEHVRQTDLVCRYGGEEFAVLLPETDLAGAMLVAEELRARIAAHTFQSGPRCVQVTASTGVATLRAHSPALPQELIAFSDKALYCAKAAGRNRVVVYSGEEDYITPQAG